MRKKLLVLALLAGTLSAQADEYPYLILRRQMVAGRLWRWSR